MGKLALLMMLCSIQATAAGDTALPEFTIVGLVDNQQFMYYDSNVKEAIPKAEWMEIAEDKNYWDTETQRFRGAQQRFRAMIANVMKAFEQTQGLHTLQRMLGCNWDEATGATDGFWQYGYDGNNFLTLDVKNMQWNASVPQASSFALKWNHNPVQLESEKLHLREECTDWLKKYVSYGRSTLERRGTAALTLLLTCSFLHTVQLFRPEMSLFQKDSSSPVVCHATGFFPHGINVTWQRDREEVHEEVKQGETLPNGDGTFQITSRLTVKPEDLKNHTYTCIVQHKSLEKELNKSK
ncbi:hypothetical protein JZ751_010849 [Albula glossodonta]|uniref:Ig-like domain-containing protein n=1 Tax=Albula glossodonta TaxID=121402 RepID=A0A8T2MWB7_9TELE|nr:hypothetical protein JZ751_010849 [Albula glossodonta]